MDTFLKNAQRIFDVARASGDGDQSDFALLIRPDGGLHFVMEASSTALAPGATCAAGTTAYRVMRTRAGGLRVTGRSGNRECVIEQHAPSRNSSAIRFSAELLRDQPLYRMTSPLTVSAGS